MDPLPTSPIQKTDGGGEKKRMIDMFKQHKFYDIASKVFSPSYILRSNRSTKYRP
jgi:hypothetical protein